ncbi:MAG: CPBP family intramembrane metalloprotease [Clostridia bacterium]|nr:CPBP family intramembrane metalloprotease [Clostridia bacterium]
MNTENGTIALPPSADGNSLRRAAWWSYFRVGLGLFLFSLIPQVLAIALSFVLPLVAPEVIAFPLFTWILQVVLMYGIAFPVAYVVIGRPSLPFPNEGSHPPFLLFFTVFCLLSTTARLGSLIGETLMMAVEAISGIPQSNPVTDMLSDTPLWVIFVVVVVLGPVVEELLFRHAVMRRLLPFGEKNAIFFSAVAFGLMHGNFYQLFYTVGMGVLIGYLYARTRMVIYPILLHMLYNFMGSILPLTFTSSLEDLLTQIESGTLTPMLLLQNALPLCGMLLYVVLVLGLSVTGVILLPVYYKRIHFAPCPHPLRTSEHVRACFANVGVILFILMACFELVLSLIP